MMGSRKYRAHRSQDALTPSPLNAFSVAKSGSRFRAHRGLRGHFSRNDPRRNSPPPGAPVPMFRCHHVRSSSALQIHAFTPSNGKYRNARALRLMDSSAAIPRATHRCRRARKHVANERSCPGTIYKTEAQAISPGKATQVDGVAALLFGAGPGACRSALRQRSEFCVVNVARRCR